jgi:hypothetical protein
VTIYYGGSPIIVTMETADEFAESQIRRFLTTLVVNRRKRLLKMMGELYGWSPETLALYEERYIRVSDCVPIFS